MSKAFTMAMRKGIASRYSPIGEERKIVGEESTYFTQDAMWQQLRPTGVVKTSFRKDFFRRFEPNNPSKDSDPCQYCGRINCTKDNAGNWVSYRNNFDCYYCGGN